MKMSKILTRILSTAVKNTKFIIGTRTSSNTALRSRKPKSIISRPQYFVDKCNVRVRAGNGGDGCISLLQAWSNENGGPDGGDGGHGGHVIFKATNDTTSLGNVHSYIEAKHGEKGYPQDCCGKNAQHNIVSVPIGTVVRSQNGTVLADLDEQDAMFIAARGGAGGRGNTFFKSDTLQAPTHAEYGAEGETHIYILEVKSMADIGLLGFPNAGKSSLLRAISRARPKVAAYAFTTLQPHIGVIQYKDYEQISVADLPGLIPGSHKNKGLGIQFLQHVERCSVLMYVVDLSISKPWEQFETLQYELSQFSETLIDRPKVIIGNKIDLPESQKNLPKFENYFKNFSILPISAKMGTNLSKLLQIIKEMYDKEKNNH